MRIKTAAAAALTVILTVTLVLFLAIGRKSAKEAAAPDTDIAQDAPVSEPEAPETEEKQMKLTVDGTEIHVIWEDNPSVDALRELCSRSPLTISMSMYGGFEQVGSIGSRLPSSDTRITTSAGDIVLYSSDSIVIFYGSNTWSYTKLGHVDGMTDAELTELLSSKDVTVTIGN